MIGWLCESLGLPLLEEAESGGVRLNAPAGEILGAARYASLGAALRPVAGERAAASLEQAVRRARVGECSELVLAQGQRALFVPAGAGRACVVLAPAAATNNDAAIQRRALATDRSARVSHELANALGAIAGWARLAKEGARVDEALELIEKSAETAWTAARTVLGEVSGQSPTDSDPGVIDLSGFVDEAARLLIPKALKKKVTVRTSITPGLCVASDRSSAWTIVWNLATNAVEALSMGGMLTLQLTAAGSTVHLCVTDNGPGMSEDVRTRVFEPYFTTKRQGTGLGLAMVKQSVGELGGKIQLESAPGKGTRFQVDLPRAAHAEKPRRRLSSAKRSSGVFLSDHLEGRFLVLDDDTSLRDMIATALQMRGAQVVVASSLSEALQEKGPFKLALVDLLLGDQRGDTALARLRAAGIVTTGLIVTGTDVPRRLAPGGEPDGVLRKPFELEDLFERVAEVLSRERDGHTAAG
ncbi:MAG TPA: ATP-binding protein [Polyangiales bacterium]